jgi:NAD(P)-dependent dehydrogenase (short-subunit alcohol dehydrogenase family)
VRELSEVGICMALPGDVASESDRALMVKELAEREHSVDVLVNNAGAIWTAPLAEYPEAGWDKVFDLNVKGCFFLIRDLVPLLTRNATLQNPSRIINVGSIDGFRIPPHESYAYPASKAALHQLSRQLARSLAPMHVTVNVIAPGLYPSKMLESALDREGIESLIAPVPLNRLAEPEDMAAAAIYLASRAGAYVTAAVVPVDGGLATTL